MAVGRVLVTGGTGKTGSHVVRGLREAGIDVVAGSRSASSSAGEVKFDWSDERTHANALAGVDAVYLVAPALVLDPVTPMLDFVRRAVGAGARRFVLLSSSAIDEGGPAMGQVHAALKGLAPEWAVLRPSWFMQNFTEGHHGDSIRRTDEIYSATGSAGVAFVDAADIAAVAVGCLTAERLENGAVVITGPSSPTYDEVAKIVASATGRPVRHVALSEAELAERFAAQGMPQDYSAFLAGLDAFLATGAEARVTDTVERFTQRRARSFEEFAAANAEAWRR